MQTRTYPDARTHTPERHHGQMCKLDHEARAQIIAAAREATGKLRDAARLGTIIEFRQRDELVVAIHRALDLLAAEGWRFIYCDSCKEIRPLVRATMPADGVNTHAAQDLLCGECRLIVATLHESDSLPTEVSDEG